MGVSPRCTVSYTTLMTEAMHRAGRTSKRFRKDSDHMAAGSTEQIHQLQMQWMQKSCNSKVQVLSALRFTYVGG